jgi:hypothetical protein
MKICNKLRETLQKMTANGRLNDMCCLWLCFLATALRGSVAGVPEREWFARKAAEIAYRYSLSNWDSIETILNSSGVGTEIRGTAIRKQGVTVGTLWQEVITYVSPTQS